MNRPSRIASFVVGECIGEGASGIVYEATQENPSRQVALKLLHPDSLGATRRFRQEAEVLGWLNHPGIARIFDAGTAETEYGPQPFIAMERIHGKPLDRYVAEGKLDVRARVELMIQLSDALQHAHQKGVIHRDLKPSNVLVTAEGQPKVLDFGIARLSERHADDPTLTRTGELLGTLPYMSPEQVVGDPAKIDSRCDVYALGVIAFELLSGKLPHEVTDLALPEAARRIREEEPTTLGQLDSRLRGDLEVIVGKALAKESRRRYDSAAALSRDLRRFLAHEPIAARRPSRTYQLAKFARRNFALTMGVAAAFAFLLAGAALSTTLYFQTSGLLLAAENEASTAGEVLGFLEAIFDESDPHTAEVSLADLTRRATTRLRGEFEDRPEVRSRVLELLGRTFNQLELGTEASDALEEALAIRRELYGPESPEVAAGLHELAKSRVADARTEESIELLRDAVRIRERHGSSEGLADSLNVLGAQLARTNQFDEAATMSERALDMYRSILGENDAKVHMARSNIAFQKVLQGDPIEAEEVFRQVLAAEAPGQTMRRIHAYRGLSIALREQRRDEEALAATRAAVAIVDEEFEPWMTMSASIRGLLAGALSMSGDVEDVAEAVAITRTLYDASVRRYGSRARASIDALHKLAFVLHESPQKEEAEAAYLETIELAREVFGTESDLYLQAVHDLSVFYLDLGRLDEAEERSREALAGRRELDGAAGRNTLAVAQMLSVILYRSEQFEEVVDVRRETLQVALEARGEESALTQDARIDLANGLRELAEYEEAEPLLLRALEAAPLLVGGERTARRARAGLRALYADWGRPDDEARYQEP